MDEQRHVYADGAVAVAGRDIVIVGPTADVLAQVRPERTIDAAGGIVHPGFIECNNHTTFHLPRGGFGDTISHRELDPILVPYFNAVDDDSENAAAMLARLEMVGNGTTCFAETGRAHEHDAVANAADLQRQREHRAGCPIIDEPGV